MQCSTLIRQVHWLHCICSGWTWRGRESRGLVNQKEKKKAASRVGIWGQRMRRRAVHHQWEIWEEKWMAARKLLLPLFSLYFWPFPFSRGANRTERNIEDKDRGTHISTHPQCDSVCSYNRKVEWAITKKLFGEHCSAMTRYCLDLCPFVCSTKGDNEKRDDQADGCLFSVCIQSSTLCKHRKEQKYHTILRQNQKMNACLWPCPSCRQDGENK